jgi:hypothetical protein
LLGDIEAYVLYPDLVVWDQITVELKAVPRRMNQGDAVRIFDYLKCRKDRIGLLVNLGLDRVEDKRYAYDAPLTRFVEDWRYWDSAMQGEDRELGAGAREALHSLYHAHGTGYGDEVFGRLIVAAFIRQGLHVAANPISKAYFHGVEVHESALDCLVLENRLAVAYSALFDDVRFSVNRGLSYLRALGLEWGLALDFGKEDAHVVGLRQLRNRRGRE